MQSEIFLNMHVSWQAQNIHIIRIHTWTLLYKLRLLKNFYLSKSQGIESPSNVNKSIYKISRKCWPKNSLEG